MPWKIDFNRSQKIIELTYSGQVSPDELIAALDAGAEMSRVESTHLILADCAGMVGGHSIVDLYALIKLFESRDLRGMKEAILLPSLQASRQDVEFYETACLNRGFIVKIFSDRQQALDWLAEDR